MTTLIAEEPKQPIAPPASPFAELRFLVVEDHGFQRWVVGSMLTKLGARFVFQASDGQEALDLFRTLEPPIDIIISDLDMPHMDGMEFMRHVGTTGIPASVIITSALDHSLISSVQVMTKAYGLDLLGALAKPVAAGELEQLILRRNPEAARRARSNMAMHEPTLAEMVDGLDHDTFEPFFQPKVEMATGRIQGVEALARWRRPSEGLVPAFMSPASFIAKLEQGGHIDRLTWMILEKAAIQCRSWRRGGLDATVSVNLSTQSLPDLSVVDRIMQIVAQHDLDPKHVVLEVTESAATTDLGPAIENLSRLRMRGFTLSLDDYGTGYSSLQQLSRIAFTELKIDKSFVRNAAIRESDRIILESTLGLARSLGISAVAEGVETQSEWDMLKGLGCDLAQGYFIAMPMAGAEFQAWAQARKR